jgi:hypothetical protein
MMSSVVEEDHGAPIFKAVSSSARQLFQLLNCIRFAPKAQVQISNEGLRFAVEESRVMQGMFIEEGSSGSHSNIFKELSFSTKHFSLPSTVLSQNWILLGMSLRLAHPIFHISQYLSQPFSRPFKFLVPQTLPLLDSRSLITMPTGATFAQADQMHSATKLLAWLECVDCLTLALGHLSVSFLKNLG